VAVKAHTRHADHCARGGKSHALFLLLCALQMQMLREALEDIFPKANQSLRSNRSINSDLSGSTGVVAVVSGSKAKCEATLTLANLGDSRCVIGESASW